MITIVSSRFKRSCELGVRSLVVLGSGGHTAEMMTMLSSLVQQNMQFRGILYALAATDRMSRFKAENSGIPGEFVVVPRAREVGQSYTTSAFTTARAFAHSFICVLRYQPQLLLCNGPGTCVPFAIAVCICRSECLSLNVPCLCSLHSQVLRIVSLLHSIRGVICSSQIAFYVRSHHVLRGRQVRRSVGGVACSLAPRSLRRRLVLTPHNIVNERDAFIGSAAMPHSI